MNPTVRSTREKQWCKFLCCVFVVSPDLFGVYADKIDQPLIANQSFLLNSFPSFPARVEATAPRLQKACEVAVKSEHAAARPPRSC